MLVKFCWLTGLLVSTGTAVQLPSTATPPYPNGSANGTVISTSSIYPSGVSSTAVSTPTPSAFYLLIADTGTPFDGEYLTVGAGLDVAANVATEPVTAASRQVFRLSANGTLWNDDSGLFASYPPSSPGDFTWGETSVDGSPLTPATCGIVDEALTCTFGETGSFFVDPEHFVYEEPVPTIVLFGSTVLVGLYPITVLVVPA